MSAWLEPLPFKKSGIEKSDIRLATYRLGQFGMALMRQMMLYPPQRGHIRYRRTGSYGRAWTIRGPMPSKGGISVIVGNAIEYAGHIGGYQTKPPRQVSWASGYGWQSIEIAGDGLWKQHKKGIADALAG